MASANVVGYNTVTISKKYNILAVNFAPVDGSDSISLQELFPYTEGNGMTAGGSSSAADSVQIMQDDGSLIAYHLSNGKVGRNTYENLVGKWAKGTETVPTEVKVKNGQAFWYISQNGETTPYTLTVAGQVAMTTSETLDLTKVYNHIGSPYPVDVPLNDCVKVTNGTLGGSSAAADNIQIYQNDGSLVAYHLSNGKVGRNTYENLIGKWAQGTETEPTTAVIPVGRGAWFISQNGASTVEILNPTSVSAE